jgi:hypothetical protein
MKIRSLGALGAAALAIAFTACGDDDGGSGSDGITIIDAWARTSPANADNGAAYMTLTSDGDDRLVGVSVSADVAAEAELHETVAIDGDTMSTEAAMGDTMAGEMGAMTMQPVAAIDLPGGTAIALVPGGLHIMLLDLAEPLVSGETFELTLTFERAAAQTVDVEVRDDAP